MSSSQLVGKAELLAWAADVTKIAPCEKYGDLKDGLVYLALARELFPREIDSAVVRLQRRGTRDAAKNWSLLASCLRRHGIPLHLCNRQAVERGHTRHCFNLLVLFYFLLRLACGQQFSVDFAQPVDPQLAEFLQSAASREAVDAAVDFEDRQEVRSNGRNTVEASAEVVERSSSLSTAVASTAADPVVTRLASPPSAHPPFSDGDARQRQQVRLGAQKSAGQTFYEGGALHGAHSNLWSRGSLVSGPSDEPSYQHTRDVPAHSKLYSRPSSRHAPALDDGVLVTTSPALPSPASSPLPTTLTTENRLLREELEYVKAISQLLITQERATAAAAEMRVAATLRDELAKAQLHHLHDLRQVEVSAAASLDPSEMRLRYAANGADVRRSQHFSSEREAVLLHRAEVAERTAAELYEELSAAHRAHDNDIAQLRGVFQSLVTITEAARAATSLLPPSTAASREDGGVPSALSKNESSTRGGVPLPHAEAAAYEEAIMEAMMAQLSNIPATLQAAFRSQVMALLLTLNTLRVDNARLQLDAQESGRSDVADAAARKQEDTKFLYGTGPIIPHHSVGASKKLTSAATSSIDIARLREEVEHGCDGAHTRARQTCAMLLNIVAELQAQLEAPHRATHAWEQRCAHAADIAASAEAARQHTRALWETEERQPPTPLADVAPQGCASAEEALRESQRLYDRVADVLLETFSTPDTEDMAWASEGFVDVFTEFMTSRRPRAALEEALAEQCDTIAQLRRDVRQRDEALEKMTAHLKASEAARKSLEQDCDALKQKGKQQQQQQQQQQRCEREDSVARTPLHLQQKLWLQQPAKDAHVGSALRTSRSVPPGQTPSPYRTGALRSPSPSESEADLRTAPATKMSLSPQSHEAFRTVPSEKLLAPSHSSGDSVESPDCRQATCDSAEPGLQSRSTTRSPTLAPTSGEAQPGSLLLSAEELERRKRDILRRYNVE